MGNKLILLVENDMNLQYSVLLMLQRAGHLTTATDSVCEAIDILQSNKYHLLISDVDMPETGNVLLPKVIRSYPNLPVIVLTDQSGDEIEAGEGRFSPHYLTKPIDPECILDCIEEIFGEDNHHSHPDSTYKPSYFADAS